MRFTYYDLFVMNFNVKLVKRHFTLFEKKRKFTINI